MLSEVKGRGGYKSLYLKVNQIKCYGIQINTCFTQPFRYEHCARLDCYFTGLFFQGCLNEILSTTSINFVKGGLLICIIKSGVLKFTL